MERTEPATHTAPPGSGGQRQQQTGSLRTDIQFIPPGEHGPYPLLYDPLSEHYYKLTDRSCRILRMLDRNYPLEEFLAKVNDAGIDADQQEIAELLSFMHQSGLMIPDYGVMNARLARIRAFKEKNLFNRLMGLYMFFRLPPIYPDRFFSRTMPVIRAVFNRYTLWLPVLAAAAGYLLMLRQWNDAYATFVNSLSWANLVNYFWAMLITKAVHELSHGYTAKSFGARVRSMGISFIVFYPRLFVDLTDTWRLSRIKRIACDGAGIASELIFGGLAAIVWVYAQPGPLKSTMFYLMTVSALGTILVNGNPFIRYDGYYLLCDLLNIENLMSRANEYMKAVNRRLFLGLGVWPDSGDASPLTLYCFGVGSFIYKLFLYTSIILIIYFQFTKAVALILHDADAAADYGSEGDFHVPQKTECSENHIDGIGGLRAVFPAVHSSAVVVCPALRDRAGKQPDRHAARIRIRRRCPAGRIPSRAQRRSHSAVHQYLPGFQYAPLPCHDPHQPGGTGSGAFGQQNHLPQSRGI